MWRASKHWCGVAASERTLTWRRGPSERNVVSASAVWGRLPLSWLVRVFVGVHVVEVGVVLHHARCSRDGNVFGAYERGGVHQIMRPRRVDFDRQCPRDQRVRCTVYDCTYVGLAPRQIIHLVLIYNTIQYVLYTIQLVPARIS